MGRLLAAFAVIAVAVAPRPAGAGADDAPLVGEPPVTCPGPAACVFDIDVPHPSTITVPGDADRPGNRVRVILPPGYDAVTGDHPGVLLLHGVGDGSESWVRNTDVEEFVAELCAAGSGCPVVVMPDGGGRHSEPGWYADWADGSRQWETFHIGHVLPWARAHLGVAGCGERWGVVGLSMGGFGALSYGARHPEQFGAIASFSGFVDTKAFAPASAKGYELASQNGYGAPTEAVFGPQGTALESDGWSEHNPTDRARAGDYRAFDGRIWIAYGTGTPGGPVGDDLSTHPASYALEAYLAELHVGLRLAFTESGTAFVDQSYLGGPHTWPYWQHALHNALPELLDSLPAACAAAVGPDAVASPTSEPMAPAARPALPATGGSAAPGLTALAVALACATRVATRRAAA